MSAKKQNEKRWEDGPGPKVLSFFISCIPSYVHMSVMRAYNFSLCEKVLNLTGVYDEPNVYDICTQTPIETWGANGFVIVPIWWFITWRVFRALTPVDH
tara:strand:+ start:154 stop:450 length:297 start_codon:yes stop_codon:yes gene_type:complete